MPSSTKSPKKKVQEPEKEKESETEKEPAKELEKLPSEDENEEENRDSHEDKGSEAELNGNAENVKPETEKNGEKKKSVKKSRKEFYRVLDSDEESIPDVNIFAETVITEAKRKRPESMIDKVANEWIVAHLSTVESKYLPWVDLFELYVSDNLQHGQVMEEYPFKQLVKEKFPEGFGFKDDSPHKYHLKEKKFPKKNKDKVKRDTPKIRMNEVIDVVLRELGNPREGIRFHKVNMTAASKYPAMRLHMFPGHTLRALEKGMLRGKIERVKGIGKCAFYRLFTEDESEADDESEPENPDDSSVPPKKRKSQRPDEETENGEGEPGDEAAEKTTLGKQSDKKTKERKKNEKKKPVSIGRISHSNPRRIEHTLPMAFTFQSEPKVATVRSVQNYIQSYYPREFTDSKFLKTLEDGFGFSDWERLSGSKLNGKVKLTLDEWNPQYDDNMRDLIINAIIACNEPKKCSSSIVRQYVEEFHPNFKATGGAFRRAWQRALDARLITQLSGLGLQGSFQLTKKFEPSPANLAGEDSHGSGTDSSDWSEPEVEVQPKSKAKAQLKSRGRLRRQHVKSYVEIPENYDDDSKRKSKRGRKATKRRGVATVVRDSDSSDEEQEVVAPKKKSASKSPKKTARSRARTTTPKKGSRSSSRSTPSKSMKEPSTDEEEDSDEEVVSTPRKRAAPKSGKKSSRGKRSKKDESSDEGQESSEAEGEAEPPSKKRKSPGKKRGRKPARGKDQSSEEEEEEATTSKRKVSKSKKKTAKSAAKKSSSRARKDVSSDDSSGEEETTTKEQSSASSPQKLKVVLKKVKSDSGSDDNDDEYLSAEDSLESPPKKRRASGSVGRPSKAGKKKKSRRK